MPELELYLSDQKVGTITPVARDKTRVALSVDRDYAPEVVLSESFLTVPGGRPSAEAVSNFLGGYVPEGRHRDRMAAKRGIDKDNLFALLSEFGGSIAGAVTLRRTDEQASARPRYEPMSEAALAARLAQALRDSDQGIPDDSRSTLPGYQPKVLAARFGDQWVYPRGRAHSTHILKPQVPARPHRIFDEHFSHLLTRALGLSSYGSQIAVAQGTTFLAIERFDRTVSADAVLVHHQEDLAQALGLDWRDSDRKFQDPYRPGDPRRATARRIATLLGSLPGAASVVDAWIRRLTFTVAIGDNDAHAKNVALEHDRGRTELSQVYDALPNLFQEELVKWDLALAIDGEFDHRRVSAERILAEVSSWGIVDATHAAGIVRATLTALVGVLEATAPPPNVSAGMPERLHRNAERLLAGTEIG